ncbi:hypothetical protein [Streptomyces sp. NPDC055107]
MVENHTDETLTLYATAHDERCLTGAFATLEPGETLAGTNNLSRVSVWVPA